MKRTTVGGCGAGGGIALISRFLIGTGAGGGRLSEPPSCEIFHTSVLVSAIFLTVPFVYRTAADCTGHERFLFSAVYLQQLTEYAFEGIASCCACAEETGVSCCQLEGTPCCCAAY